ncbi:putative Invariant surface glycoprotein [Trypanosoma vivax]|nr:putative Invariant surface glycoprotein [Trypanosoma vivax]
MPKAGSDGSINCGSIPDVGGTSASAANMIAALSDWDVRKPYFDANYSRSSRVNCTKNSTVVCSVLEDWMPSFFASAVSLAKAEKAFLDFADVAAFAYDAFMETRQAIDEAEKFAWAMDVKASISAANMTTQLRSCLLASREKMNISNFTLAANNTRFLTFLADALSHSRTVSTSALIVMHLMLLAAPFCEAGIVHEYGLTSSLNSVCGAGVLCVGAEAPMQCCGTRIRDYIHVVGVRFLCHSLHLVHAAPKVPYQIRTSVDRSLRVAW